MKYLKLFEKFNIGEIIDNKYEIMQIFNPKETKDDQLEYIAKYNDNYYLIDNDLKEIAGPFESIPKLFYEVGLVE